MIRSMIDTTPGIEIPSIPEMRYRHSHIARRLCQIVICKAKAGLETWLDTKSLPRVLMVDMARKIQIVMYDPRPPRRPVQLHSSATLLSLFHKHIQEGKYNATTNHSKWLTCICL